MRIASLALMILVTVPVCAPAGATTKGSRSQKQRRVPLVFYLANTQCSDDRRADLTYREADGTEQNTEDLPWVDFREFHPGDFYYISAQKRSGSDDCDVWVSIWRVDLTPAQLDALPRDTRGLIRLVLDQGHEVAQAQSSRAYGIAEADWSGRPGQ